MCNRNLASEAYSISPFNFPRNKRVIPETSLAMICAMYVKCLSLHVARLAAIGRTSAT